jgi:hypothetical protein
MSVAHIACRSQDLQVAEMESEVMLLLTHALVKVKAAPTHTDPKQQPVPLPKWLSQRIQSYPNLLGATCWRHQPEAWEPVLIKAQESAACLAASAKAARVISVKQLADEAQKEAVRKKLQDRCQQQVPRCLLHALGVSWQW